MQIELFTHFFIASKQWRMRLRSPLLNWCARNNARHLNSATSLCRRVETKQLKKRNWHKNQFDCARTHNARAWFNLIFIENFTDLHNEFPQHTQSLTTDVANYNNETGANQMLSRMRARCILNWLWVVAGSHLMEKITRTPFHQFKLQSRMKIWLQPRGELNCAVRARSHRKRMYGWPSCMRNCYD